MATDEAVVALMVMYPHLSMREAVAEVMLRETRQDCGVKPDAELERNK